LGTWVPGWAHTRDVEMVRLNVADQHPANVIITLNGINQERAVYFGRVTICQIATDHT
jgi:hypothetical protein